MDQKFSNKLKEGVSVREIEEFARKHTVEAFFVLAILIATISSAFDFFTGSGWSVIFTSLGLILAVFFADRFEAGVKRCCQFFHKQERFTQIVLGVVKIVLALFVPFVLFFIVGVLAGTAYHYYIRRCQSGESCKQSTPGGYKRGNSSEEHD